MRQVTRKGLMTMAAATGVIAAAGASAAHAGSGASGTASNSPGVLSGNSVQAPVHAPVNVCGNTVDVVGALNPAMGNSCANHSGSQGGQGGGSHADGGHQGGHGHSGGSGAHGGTSHSPGVGSGNNVQAPVDAPVNLCGNSVDIIGIANPAMGNECSSDDGYGTPPDDGYGTPPSPPEDRNIPPSPPTGHPPTTPGEHPPTPGHRTPEAAPPPGHSVPQPHGGQLAATGAELPMGAAAAIGFSAVLGGAVLYRRKRVAA
ncbi:chaplin [Streptomyces sp. NPDC005017]|uniref:chaplin n=1 Tax=Streptomyces sp. NPDC005017 TaxID=3364706 RepID=UPI0036BB06DE